MGVKEQGSLKEEKALLLARKIAIHNSEIIYNVKNSLILMTESLQKSMVEDHEKLTIIINNDYPKIDPGLLLANTKNNHNHDLLKVDVELIKDMLMEADDESGN